MDSRSLKEPSCDSPELLEVIRADDERIGEFVSRVKPEHVRISNVQTLQAQRRALLRMVDELTKERDIAAEWARGGQDKSVALRRERDDLRAKLSATNTSAQSVWVVVEHDGRPYEFWTRREDVCEPLPEGGAVVQYVKAADVMADCPEFDATDGAHPAWWRGHDYTAKKFEELVADLRAKLAEAERDFAQEQEVAISWRERAEAVEARVKHLEQAVAWRQAQIEGRIKTGGGL